MLNKNLRSKQVKAGDYHYYYKDHKTWGNGLEQDRKNTGQDRYTIKLNGNSSSRGMRSISKGNTVGRDHNQPVKKGKGNSRNY
jgi:hypothetical protein